MIAAIKLVWYLGIESNVMLLGDLQSSPPNSSA